MEKVVRELKLLNKKLCELIGLSSTPPEPPIDYTPLFETIIEKQGEMLDEMKNDDSYQLFEDTDGNVLFGKLDDEGVMKYYKPDGSEYTGEVKPYSRETKQTITDYCADGIPYSLIQLRDADTKEVIATIWRNDSDLTESNTAPANITKGVCVTEDLTGKSCETPSFSKICNFTDITDPIANKIQELIDASNNNSQAEQALLTSIDTKLDELVLIKDELVTANATLTGIKTDTAKINTNLETVIEKLDTQITKLEDLKVLVTATNTKLDTANATLTTISTDIATIKTDIGLIKTDISEIKTDVKTIITKLEAVVTSLTAIETKLDTVVTELQTINTTLQTEFDQTQTKLDEIKGAIELKGSDCDNKVFTNICNIQELADAINAGATPPIDYTSLLTDIKNNTSNLTGILDVLNLIKEENIEINVNLEELITLATNQLTKLTNLETLITEGNASLVVIKDKLVSIDTNIATLVTDISAIKTGVESIDSKLDDVLTAIGETNTLLQSLLDELDVELVPKNVLKFNDGTYNFYSQELELFDSETGLKISSLFQKSTDGVTWEVYTPTGSEEIGWITPFIVLGESVEHCAVKNDGTKSQIFIRQNYTFDNKTEEKTRH